MDTSFLEQAGEVVKTIAMIILILRISAIVLYLLNAYPLYQMGKKAGYEFAWFAWFPVLCNYLFCILPKKKFSLFGGKIVIKDRLVSFLLYYLLRIIPNITALILNLLIPGIGLLLSAIVYVIAIPTYFINYVWTRDFYEAYRPGQESANKALAFISVLFPVVKWVMLSLIYKNPPYYGFGMYPYAQEYDPNATV